MSHLWVEKIASELNFTEIHGIYNSVLLLLLKISLLHSNWPPREILSITWSAFREENGAQGV